MLLVGLLATYWPCLHGQFLWDDIMFISDNELVKQPNGLWKIWFSTESTDYWPVSYSLFWLLWQTFGTWTLPFHLTGLALHLANALLVERILVRLGLAGATLAAVLFAFHPVQAESVAWIFQIKTTLSATFALLALHWWLGARTKSSLVGFAAGLLSKTAIVTWPLVLLEATWWRERKIERRRILRLAPFLTLSAVTGLVGLLWYRYGELTGGERVRTDHGLETLVIAARAFWFYVGKALWPVNLVFIYPRWTIDLSDWTEYLPLVSFALAALAGVIALWFGRTRWPLALFAYVFLTLFPVLGFANVYFFRFSFVADHYQYLASIGPMCLAAWVIGRMPKLTRLPIAGLLVFGLAKLTLARAEIYRDEPTVWRDTLERNSGAWLALYNSGNIAYGEGKLDVALDLYTRAVGSKPDYVDAWVGLGAAHLALKREAEAQADFERALELFPGHARALNNLAAMALGRGDALGAARHLEEAVKYLPDYALGHKNLGLVYMQLGHREAALRAMRRAHDLRPDDPDVKANLERLQRTE